MFDDALVTVWSAPNYCYRCGNLASILTVREDGERVFTVYEAAEENERDKGMQTRKMVSVAVSLWVDALLKLAFYRARCHILCRFEVWCGA